MTSLRALTEKQRTELDRCITTLRDWVALLESTPTFNNNTTLEDNNRIAELAELSKRLGQAHDELEQPAY